MHPILSDSRCQSLWEVSDLRTLAVVHARWPDICPEYPFLVANNAVFLEPELLQRRYDSEPVWVWGGSPHEYFAQECANVERLSRYDQLRRLLTQWGTTGAMLDVGGHLGAWAALIKRDCPGIAHVFVREAHRAAAEYAMQHAGPGITVEWGTHLRPSLPDVQCAWAGEIVEHQWDWRAFLTAIERVVAPGGRIVCSTPVGPWESPDATHLHGHVAHWEFPDLRAVFGHKPGFEVWGEGGASNERGVFMWTFCADHEPYAAFPIEEKLARWGF